MLQSWSKTFITLSYFVVFCCADFCFLYAILYTHYFAYYYDRHSQTVSVVDILSDLLVLLFGDPFFFFLYRNACCFIIHYCCCFFFYILCLMFLFWCTLILYLYSNTFVNSLKRTMSLGRLSRKRNREINVDSQSELSEQKSSLWVAYFCLLGCTNGLAFQV